MNDPCVRARHVLRRIQGDFNRTLSTRATPACHGTLGLEHTNESLLFGVNRRVAQPRAAVTREYQQAFHAPNNAYT